VDTDRAALNRLPRWFVAALAAMPVVFIIGLYAWPVANLVWSTAGDRSVAGASLRHVGGVLWFTTWQALASTALTLAVGLAPAYVLARYRFRGRRALLALATVPFVLPTVVVGAAFLALLPSSWHGSARAMIVAHVFFNIAVVVRLVGAMIAVVPHDLAGAARTLGASPARAVVTVLLPLLAPALWSAAAVIFLFCFTSFGVATLLGGPAHPTLEVEIARRATQLGDVRGAALLSVLQLAVLAVLIAATARRQRRAARQLPGAAGAHRVRTRRERRVVAGVSLGTVVVIGAPVVALVARSFDTGSGLSLTAWKRLGTVELRPGVGLGIDPMSSIVTSLRFAAVAAAIATIVGFLAAAAISAAPRLGRILDTGLMLPLATSAVTIGLGMLITFDTAPFDWRARWWLIPLGHALVAVPFVVRSLVNTLRAVPADLRAAAATLGASPVRAWWHVDARALRRPVLAGIGFSAAISLGEFGATTVLTRSASQTVPIAIARLLGRAGGVPRAQAFVLATILLAITAAVIMISGTRERLGADEA
jgi:thiamine transport system permease protein